MVLQAGGSDLGLAMAAGTADVVFSVVQGITEAQAQYAAFKGRLPGGDRLPSDVVILPGVMPVVGRTDREAFDTLAAMQDFVDSTNAACSAGPIWAARYGIISVSRARRADDGGETVTLRGPCPLAVPRWSYQRFQRTGFGSLE